VAEIPIPFRPGILPQTAKEIRSRNDILVGILCRTGFKPVVFEFLKGKTNRLEQVTEIVIYFVIPNEVRNLSLV
jgi:hypothetical protein